MELVVPFPRRSLSRVPHGEGNALKLNSFARTKVEPTSDLQTAAQIHLKHEAKILMIKKAGQKSTSGLRYTTPCYIAAGNRFLG